MEKWRETRAWEKCMGQVNGTRAWDYGTRVWYKGRLWDKGMGQGRDKGMGEGHGVGHVARVLISAWDKGM